MSRFLPDRLYISLTPGAVALVRRSGLLRPCLVSKTSVECDPHFGSRPWEGAIEALRLSIKKISDERLRANVVLSNCFVRYAVIPNDDAISGAEEEEALARFHFTRVHGERARTWALRLSNARPGQPRLASAIDAGLVEALRGCFPPDGRARLASIQPYLMAAFNRSRRELGKGAWLVLLEPGRACIALASATGWQAVQSLRFDLEDESWMDLLDRERLRACESTEKVVRLSDPAARFDLFVMALSAQ